MSPPPIPYKLAVLVYVFNDAGKLLLLHRRKHPNKDLYSPIGGKLEQGQGESPYACALREIAEEIEVDLTLDDIRLLGIVSERGYMTAPPARDSITHWLLFCFEVTRPLNFKEREFEEGRLEWIDPAAVPDLSIPRTDREIIWPLVQQHSRMLNATKPAPRGAGGPPAIDSVFSVHIDCSDAENLTITYEHPRMPTVHSARAPATAVSAPQK